MKKTQGFGKRLGVSALVLLGLLLVGSVIAAIFSADGKIIGANTAVIRVVGPIMSTSGDGIFSNSVTTSTSVVEKLQQARDDPQITAVILEINSPGGSAVASDEIALAVIDVRKTGKPVVAWIREVGASGAFWVATASDHVVANRMSITGSIGVIGSYLEFPEFLEEWNLTYNRLVAGDNKDIGNPFQELTYQDRAFIQQKLDTIHEFFIAEVAKNRNLSVNDVRDLADGQFFLGIEAFDAGLIDELGGEPEAIAYLEEQTGTPVTTTLFEDKAGLFEELLGIYQARNALSVRGFVPMAR